MNTIKLCNVVPHVFVNDKTCDSEIWNREVLFEKGKTYLVEADSGKGKSTFCSYILGYRNDFTGQIFFDQEDTKTLKVSRWVDIRKRHVSHLFQELRLFPELTAFENVEIKNKLTDFKPRKQIEEWFEMIGIADKLETKARYMSFGQQQRVAMIRALVQPFDFILADEPISHLDENNSQTMSQMMMDEAKRQGAGVILTSIGRHVDLSYERTLKL
ncbi:MAG: ATP-binding cassette domain-containing protein [Prevotellaceae bacterium]|nr:ATP-binding cassette domain-containing protein [Prevotella sp.]MDD7256798.1 ATP-binding cassette domain-containing protein [Prevotellaceae bacterium]MDY6131032.1 ATP-binding cassette domain-containing protein [Prevotella sp.]